MKTTLKNMPTVINPFGHGFPVDPRNFQHVYQEARRLKTNGYEHMVLQLQASHCYDDLVILPDYSAAQDQPDNITVCPVEALDVYSYQNFAKSLQVILVDRYNETHEDKISA